ncbi:MAG: hypothetical protein Q9O74_12535 [Planctomycetota bacterium]|nr:hypothetical protein [Planctomycetota bacterium]
MHILTKVFIVFAAVLSLVLSVLTMAYAYNADTIRSQYTDALQQAATAKADATAQKSAYADTSARQQQQISELQGLLADLDARNADLVRENTTLVAGKQKAENRALAIENQIGDSLQTTKAQAAVIDSMRRDNAKLRESELSLRTASLELEDRVNDLASQNDVYQATVRALREQLAAAQRDAELAMSGASGSLGSDTPYEASGPVIRGRVSRVSFDEASGQPLIEVDIGSNDRLSENMKLHVGRGTSEFIATLVVVRTDLQTAVARVVLTNAGASVREGDLVVSRFVN